MKKRQPVAEFCDSLDQLAAHLCALAAGTRGALADIVQVKDTLRALGTALRSQSRIGQLAILDCLVQGETAEAAEPAENE